jgi:hypothetical protein
MSTPTFDLSRMIGQVRTHRTSNTKPTIASVQVYVSQPSSKPGARALPGYLRISNAAALAADLKDGDRVFIVPRDSKGNGLLIIANPTSLESAEATALTVKSKKGVTRVNNDNVANMLAAAFKQTSVRSFTLEMNTIAVEQYGMQTYCLTLGENTSEETESAEEAEEATPDNLDIEAEDAIQQEPSGEVTATEPEDEFALESDENASAYLQEEDEFATPQVDL